jgi:glycosyltransferase involved in cell wall biosynthesis
MSARRPIRLFVDAHVLDQEFQGTRTFIREIYSILADKDDILLFLAAHDIENLKRNFPARGNVHFLPYKSRSSLVRLGREIPAMLKEHDIDYAHFQYITPLFKRGRYIVTIHDVIFSEYPDEFSLQYRILKKFLYKRSALMADIVTTVSEYSERSIRKFLGVGDATPIHIVPNGVGPKFFAPYDRQQSKEFISRKYGVEKPILYVSRIEPRKNHVFLLKAFLELELYKRGYYLALLGHQSIPLPELDMTLEALPEEIRKFIFMSDKVGDADLMEFYRAAEVFVYPSRAEGFGIPPLEAAALQVPVICSNSSAMEQFAFFGEYHIDPYDLPLLKTKLIKILEEQPSAAVLAGLSRIVHEEFSWERAAEALYKAVSLHLPLQLAD